MKKLISLCLVVLLLLSAIPMGFAAAPQDRFLNRLELLQTTMKITGKYEEALAYKSQTVIKDAGANKAIIGYGVDQRLMTLDKSKKFKPTDKVSNGTAYFTVLKALGYTVTDKNALEQARKLGITNQTDIQRNKVALDQVFLAAMKKLEILIGPKKSIELLSVTSVTNTEILLTFKSDKPLDPNKVTQISNYKLAEMYGLKRPLIITAAKITGVNQVTLTTAPQEGSTLYTIQVVEMTDMAGNTLNVEKSAAAFVGTAPVVIPSTVEVLSAISLSNTEVEVTFKSSGTLDRSVMGQISNYKINEAYGTKAALAISGIKSLTDTKVVLTTSPQVGSTLYAVQVLNASLERSKATFPGTAPVIVVNPFEVLSAVALSNTEVEITFRIMNPLDLATVTDLGNYNLIPRSGSSDVLHITSARKSGDNKIILTTMPQTGNMEYLIEVFRMKDILGNVMRSENYKAYFMGKAAIPVVTPVEVSSATALSNTEVEVAFKSTTPISGSEYTKASNYTINLTYGNKAPLNVSAVRLSTDNKVILTTAPQLVANLYTVTAAIPGIISNKSNFVGLAPVVVPPPVTVQGTIEVVESKALSNTEVEVTLSAPGTISQGDAEMASNYAIALKYGTKTPLGILRAEYLGSNKVKLTTASLQSATLYQVTLVAMKDDLGNTINASKSTSVFAGIGAPPPPVLESGIIELVDVEALSTEVLLTFATSSALTRSTAENVSSYALNGKYGTKRAVAIISAEWVSENQVLLTTEPHEQATLYEVKVNNMDNDSGDTMNMELNKRTYLPVY